MMCSRCNKRVAVVFITKIEDGKTVNQGLCLECAKELGIKPAVDAAAQMGITQDDIDRMGDELMQLMNPEDGEAPEELMASEDGSFSEGGAVAFPFLKNLFSGMPKGEESAPEQKEKEPKSNKNAKRKVLESHCINLVARAKRGELDTVVGRDREIARVIQILNRRTKNNPCLIGEPGVGKTAVAEGLAMRIAAGDVPAKLADKEIYLLDLTSLVAGTQFRGQFESRMKALIDEVKKLGNIILFIDEVHNLVGAGDAEGSMNAANILKPAMSRGEIQVIGATTYNEYRKHIEKDAALERRFQPVSVDEPTVDETVEILKGIRTYYERFHGVTLPDRTLRQAAVLSERYITDRFLPDKAIDLLDEASSAASIGSREYNEMYRAEKRLRELATELSEVAPDGSAERYERIAELKADECRLQEELDTLRQTPKPEVTMGELAKVIELWTGIPASKIGEDEFAKLEGLRDRLRTRIVGQDEVIDSVCAAIKKNRVGLSVKKKPVSFIFTGPTGVGKTELVKTLARELFDSVETLIRLDMSEFMEKHAVSRIVGAPPGYVGYDEAGQLTEKIRRKPYSVVLFDEIEKAHPDVLNVLLQILDDGRITDAHGRVVNFENTIIIMTSNAGSDRRDNTAGFNRTVEEQSRDRVMKALGEFLRPEFLNRVDEIVVFRGLSKPDLRKIAEIMLSDLAGAMSETGRTLRWSEEVLSWLSEKAYSVKYNARSLRRTVEKEVEGRIAELIISHAGKGVETVSLSVSGDELVVSV